MCLLSFCHHSLLYPSLLGLLLIFQNSKWKRPWLSVKNSWVNESFFSSLTFPRQGGQLSWNPHAHHSSLLVSLASFLGSKDCGRVRQGCMLPLENFTLQEFSFPHNIMLWFLPFDSTPSQVLCSTWETHPRTVHPECTQTIWCEKKRARYRLWFLHLHQFHCWCNHTIILRWIC